MTPLSSSQRKYLRGLAHHLDPVVLVGKPGLSENLVQSALQALDAHELIKVRFNEFKDQKKALAEELATRTGSQIAGIIGHVAILYRPQPDEDKRKIFLPQN